MLLVNLFNFLRGYVIITVKGLFIERFINICIRRQIYLWNIQKTRRNIMKTNISIKAFKKLRPVAYKTKCKVNIIRKKGLPFILHKYKKRKAFIIGILLFVFSLCFLTSFVWVLEVEGNDTVETGEIIQYLEHYNLRPGTLKSRINTDFLENRLMLEIDKLSWVSIEVKGTKAIIRVKEGRLPPDIIEKDIPCNIVALRDGVISSIVAKSGTPVVKEGDTVERGQLLVSGIAESKVDGTRYVHSMGTVRARTWYEESKQQSLTRINKAETGNKITRFSVKFMDMEIKLQLNSSIPYSKYVKIINEKNLKIGSDYVFPFSIKKETYREIKFEKEKLDEQDVVKQVYKDLYKSIEGKLISDASEIINEELNTTLIDENTIKVNLTVECIEDIGIQEKIILD